MNASTLRPEPAPEPDSRAQVAEVQAKVQRLEERDFQLWSIAVLVVLVLAAGVFTLMFPNLLDGVTIIRADPRYLPQLLYGFITLVVLFNIYMLKQRRELRRTREELVHQLMYTHAVERLTLVDPLTQTFNRRYMDEVITKDLSRADRLGIALTFVMIDVDDFKVVNTRFGHLMGDRVLAEVAQVLKTTLRSSDVIIRYGGDEFLVMMENSDEPKVQAALNRLQKQVDAWNQANSMVDYKMRLTWGVATYQKGSKIEDVLDEADRKMFAAKAK